MSVKWRSGINSDIIFPACNILKQSRTNFLTIKEKALVVWENIKKNIGNPAEVLSSSEDGDWLSRFKNDSIFHILIFHIKLSGRAVSADKEAVKTCLCFKNFREVVYILDCIFNLADIGLD